MSNLANYVQVHTSLVKTVGLVVAMILGLTGCGEKDTSHTSPTPEASIATIALSPSNQEIYDISCKVCHEQSASGAPLTGKAADWKARDAQDMASVLKNVLDGSGNMPAMGGCFDCSDEQFTAIIGHMSAGVIK